MTKVKKYKRVQFSLDEKTDVLINKFSNEPGFRCTRSDVIRAGLNALKRMTKADRVAALMKAQH